MGKKRQAKLYSPTYDEWQTQLASVLAIETGPLFVFSMVGPKQNAGSPFSVTVLNALSHGTLGFALHFRWIKHSLLMPIHFQQEITEKVGEVLSERKLDSVINVAGGWAGGSANKADFIKNCDLTWRQVNKSRGGNRDQIFRATKTRAISANAQARCLCQLFLTVTWGFRV